jgi:hypothetical protein
LKICKQNFKLPCKCSREILKLPCRAELMPCKVWQLPQLRQLRYAPDFHTAFAWKTLKLYSLLFLVAMLFCSRQQGLSTPTIVLCVGVWQKGLPKVSAGPAMPVPSTPRGRTTPEMALQPFRGWPSHRAGGLRPSSTPLAMEYAYVLLRIVRRDSWVIDQIHRMRNHVERWTNQRSEF